MRLTAKQKASIQSIVRNHLGGEAAVFVFGSRLEDNRKGGDVDLLIETSAHVPVMQKAALKMALEDTLSLPVDLTLAEGSKPHGPFQALARAQAQPLQETG